MSITTEQFNQMKLALETGEYAIINSKKYGYKLMTPFRDDGGGYLVSDWSDTEEEVLTDGDWNFEQMSYCTKQGVSVELIRTFQPIYPTIPVGTKVKVREEVTDICRELNFMTDVCHDEIVGRVFELTSSIGNTYGLKLGDSKISFFLPRQALTVFTGEEEDDEVEKAIKLLESKGKIRDGKIII